MLDRAQVDGISVKSEEGTAMARITPIRPDSAVPPKPTGLRGWIARLRNWLDRLVYQLIRVPSRRARGPVEGKAGKASGRR